MNAEDFGKQIAGMFAERDRKHAAEMASLRDQIIALEKQVAAIPPVRDGRDGLPGVPGPPGEKGEPGQNGFLRMEDVALEYDGERTITIAGKALELPVPIYRDVWQSGGEYKSHDVVTWGGSMWICKTPSADQPGTSTAWRLVVNKGRDARER